MTRYEYTFVRIALKGEFITGNLDPAYQNEIHRMALEGWRFVQAIFPTISASYAEKGDLVFERQVATVTATQPPPG